MYGDEANSLDAVLNKNYSIDVGGFLNRGWAIFSQNVGGFIGFFVLSIVISAVLGNIPGIGPIANGVVSGVLAAGYFIVAFKLSRGQSSEFGDFFKGFQNSYFLPIFLANLVIGIFTGVLSLAFVASLVAAFYSPVREFLVENSDDPDIANLPDIPIPDGLIGPLIIVGILLLLPAIYLGIAYTFAIPLIIDRRMDFWPAMETSRKLITKKWFGFFGFSIVLGLINMGGALICGLGLLLTVPLSVCAIAAAYENIVGLTGDSAPTDAV
jgi:uncharacterized membrane protein